MPLLLGFIIFQVGWLTVILGSQNQIYLTVIPMIVGYLVWEAREYRITTSHYLARLLVAVIGFLVDSLLQSLQLIEFNTTGTITSPGLLATNMQSSGTQITEFQASLAPFWLLLMWFWFMATFSSCYQWLVGKTGVAIAFAAIFGPVAYWGASKLTNVVILDYGLFFLVSSLFWGGLFAAIFSIPSIRQQIILSEADKKVALIKETA